MAESMLFREVNRWALKGLSIDVEVAATGYEEISQRASRDASLDSEAPVKIPVCRMYGTRNLGVTRA